MRVAPAAGADPAAAAIAETAIWVDGGDSTATVYDRGRLAAGHKVDGPAIVSEMDSTTLVLPGHVGEVDGWGNIVIRPKGD